MRNIDCDKILHGEITSLLFSCWQHLTLGTPLAVVIGVSEENTNKLTELMASASSNKADFLIGISCFFLVKRK